MFPGCLECKLQILRFTKRNTRNPNTQPQVLACLIILDLYFPLWFGKAVSGFQRVFTAIMWRMSKLHIFFSRYLPISHIEECRYACIYTLEQIRCPILPSYARRQSHSKSQCVNTECWLRKPRFKFLFSCDVGVWVALGQWHIQGWGEKRVKYPGCWAWGGFGPCPPSATDLEWACSAGSSLQGRTSWHCAPTPGATSESDLGQASNAGSSLRGGLLRRGALQCSCAGGGGGASCNRVAFLEMCLLVLTLSQDRLCLGVLAISHPKPTLQDYWADRTGGPYTLPSRKKKGLKI